MKKLISLILSLCILMLIIPAFPISASAEDTYTEGSIIYTVTDGAATITDYTSRTTGDFTIPSTLGDYPVVAIGDNAFQSCYFSSIIIPSGVTSIGNGAFSEGWRLTSVTLPNSVTSIGDNAFSGCSRLTSATIPSSVTSIGMGIFYNCPALSAVSVDSNSTSFTAIDGVLFNKDKTAILQYPQGKEDTSYVIPEGVTSIEGEAFRGCSKLTAITIPEGVTSIGYNAFSGCTGLPSITIPNSVTSIGELAFYYCSLNSIVIPGSVTSIGDMAFYNSGLKSITLEEGVTSIGSFAFQDCGGLTSITIPSSVTSIGDYAFLGCPLTSITVDAANPAYSSLDGVLFNKDKTTLILYPQGESNTSYTIPNSVTSIESYAFRYATSLTSVTIPDSVVSIGEGAFEFCFVLTSVTIGNNVASIGRYAFRCCFGLLSITIPRNVTSIEDYTFFQCEALKDVYYGGTQEEWANIPIGIANNSLTNVTIHYMNLSPMLSGTVTNSTLTITPENIPTGSRISYAAYKGNKMVSFDTFIYSGTGKTFPITVDYDYIKLFTWDGLEPLINPTEV